MTTINLKEKLRPENIFLDVVAEDRFDLIRQVISRMNDRDVILDSSLLAEAACQREEELSTGIDRGIAMPHARTDAVAELICAFVRPATPISFGSTDGQACDLVFFSAVPRKLVDQYLHFTAAIVRKLQQPQTATNLREAVTEEDVLNALGI